MAILACVALLVACGGQPKTLEPLEEGIQLLYEDDFVRVSTPESFTFSSADDRAPIVVEGKRRGWKDFQIKTADRFELVQGDVLVLATNCAQFGCEYQLHSLKDGSLLVKITDASYEIEAIDADNKGFTLRECSEFHPTISWYTKNGEMRVSKDVPKSLLTEALTAKVERMQAEYPDHCLLAAHRLFRVDTKTLQVTMGSEYVWREYLDWEPEEEEEE